MRHYTVIIVFALVSLLASEVLAGPNSFQADITKGDQTRSFEIGVGLQAPITLRKAIYSLLEANRKQVTTCSQPDAGHISEGVTFLRARVDSDTGLEVLEKRGALEPHVGRCVGRILKKHDLGHPDSTQPFLIVVAIVDSKTSVIGRGSRGMSGDHPLVGASAEKGHTERTARENTTRQSGATTAYDVLKVEGAHDKSVVVTVFRARGSAFSYCYEKWLQDDDGLAGKVDLNLKIFRDGSVSGDVVTSTVKSEKLEGCLLQVADRLVFPQTAAETEAMIRFEFSSNSHE